MQPQDFYMRTKASRGVLLEMVDPAGEKEWIRVRSVLSAEFVAASTAVTGQAEAFSLRLDGMPKADAKRERRRRRARLAAVLVAEWSLPMKTTEEIAGLLEINPRLRRQIEVVSENHAMHFGVAV